MACDFLEESDIEEAYGAVKLRDLAAHGVVVEKIQDERGLEREGVVIPSGPNSPESLRKSRGPLQNPAETPQNPRRDLRRALGETPAEPSERQIFSESLAEGVCPSDGDPPELKKMAHELNRMI